MRGSRNKNLLMLGAGLMVGTGLGLFILFGIIGPRIPVSGGADQPRGASVAAPIVGSVAPDFELQALSGENVRLSDLRGRPVLLNFWATWCGPCEVEMPLFQSRYETRSADFEVLAVNFAEAPAKVQNFIEERELTFPILLDPDAEVQRLYNIHGYPTTLIMDAEGIIRVYHIGVMTESQLDGYLKDVGVGG